MDPVNNFQDHESNAQENVNRLHELKDMDSVRDYYDKWIDGGMYDQQLKDGYSGAATCAQALLQHYLGNKLKDISILDIGAGSGLVAEELIKMGFVKIDAVEPSEQMAKKAKEKQLYKKIYNIFFTENVPSLDTDSYDAIVSSGSFGPGHIPLEALSEFTRIVKPGGMVVIVVGKIGYEDKIIAMRNEVKRMEKNGKLECISMSEFPNYYYDNPGNIFVMKILQ